MMDEGLIVVDPKVLSNFREDFLERMIWKSLDDHDFDSKKYQVQWKPELGGPKLSRSGAACLEGK